MAECKNESGTTINPVIKYSSNPQTFTIPAGTKKIRFYLHGNTSGGNANVYEIIPNAQ